MTAKRPPGLLKQPAGSGVHRAHFARGKKALAKIGEVGKDRCRQIEFFPAPAGNADPPLQAGFALWVRCLAASANCRAGLRAHGERGVIFSALQPRRLRLSRRRDVLDLPPADQHPSVGIPVLPASGIHNAVLNQDCAAGGGTPRPGGGRQFVAACLERAKIFLESPGIQEISA